MGKTKRRNRRLKSVKNWLAEYYGDNLVEDYRAKVNVNRICALLDLDWGGYPIDYKELESLRKKQRENAEAVKKQKREEQHKQKELEKQRLKQFRKEQAHRRQWELEQEIMREEHWMNDNPQNEVFYFIAGYTSAGYPYGITWYQYYKELQHINTTGQGCFFYVHYPYSGEEDEEINRQIWQGIEEEQYLIPEEEYYDDEPSPDDELPF
ncbi:MAG: hypothetical protein K9I68_11250 [Bacteroidales bacterium]|nr:hypothetical protein [Bacteroidales bacterium]